MAMYHRQITPPYTTVTYAPSSSNGSCCYYDSSPHSVGTTITTPPKSPIHAPGAFILPKVRTQDLVTEPTAGPIRHRRAVSTISTSYGSTYNPYSRAAPSARRGASSYAPSGSLISPVSAEPSPFEAGFSAALTSPITFAPSGAHPSARRASLAHARAHSASYSARGHSRNGSASSVDESVLGKYGYPTYRRMPSYVTNAAGSAAPQNLAVPAAGAAPASAYSYTYRAPSSEYYPAENAPAPAVRQPSPLTYDSYYSAGAASAHTTTLMEYLTSPNPAPALVRRITAPSRGGLTAPHFWWDVRNLRSWSSFNISSVISVPGFLQLLSVPVSDDLLPQPRRPSHHAMTPDSDAALHDLYRDFYASKLNAALAVSQGATHISMRACRPAATPGSRLPDFVSNYSSDYEKTVFGDARGRVVGLVKAYDAWNSGMRAEAPNRQVLYLQGLAHLHRVMREHGCRYGFIMTEIELVCVRCGGGPRHAAAAASADPSVVNASNGVPLFGYLELAAPIRLSAHHSAGRAASASAEPDDYPHSSPGSHKSSSSRSSSSSSVPPQLTAPLALWYLHMLAKQSPPPPPAGDADAPLSWRMDVGGPAALTRHNALERDGWMPKPNIAEKREAKRVRGWIFPEEGLSRKELSRGKRTRRG